MSNMRNFELQRFAVDANTVKDADLAKTRDVDFTLQFESNIQTLVNMLGVTRLIPKNAGEVLKVYKVTGSLKDNGEVAEGEVIPLSSLFWRETV